MSRNNEYEIGYKKPPIEHQFKAGISGNPKGRPKNSSTFLDAIQKDLSTKITVMENGASKKMTKLEAISIKFVSMILNGDKTMLREFNRLYADKIDLESYLNTQNSLPVANDKARSMITRAIYAELDRRFLENK